MVGTIPGIAWLNSRVGASLLLLKVAPASTVEHTLPHYTSLPAPPPPSLHVPDLTADLDLLAVHAGGGWWVPS